MLRSYFWGTLCTVFVCVALLAGEGLEPNPEILSSDVSESTTTEASQPQVPPQSEVAQPSDTQPRTSEEPQALEAPPGSPREACNGSAFSRSMRTSVRYTTPRGIGYSPGYTTLSGFFSSPLWFDPWIPFLDVRAHIFDNGKFSMNAGLGTRYLHRSRLWGINAYYDYRNMHRQHYNQVSAGLENLGKIWDFRLNGYFPVGSTKSRFFNTRFYAFKGHELLLQQTQDFALTGANAEAGYHFERLQNMPLYFAAGPYYLTGQGQTAWGGQLRASIEFFDGLLRIEGNTSYDNLFNWIGQGRLSVNWSFGKRAKFTPKEDMSCSNAALLATRAVQPVDRSEIIPVKRERVVAPAINPGTGQDWVFWFVNNTSHSLGTFESPFPTLVQAQNASAPNQAIYVFPGDTTTNGMNSGITLQNSQLMLGASIVQPIPTTVGIIAIPPLASTAPNITNLGGDVVTLASDNKISGFNISVVTPNTNQFTGTGISNLNVSQNTFTTSNTNSSWILLTNCTGSVLVENNTYTGLTQGMSLNSSTIDTLNLIGNSFSSGVIANHSSINTLNLLGNTFTTPTKSILNSGTITTLISTYDSFKNVINDYVIFNHGTITNLIVSNDIFDTIVNNDAFNRPCIYNIGAVGDLIVINTTFSNLTMTSAIVNNGGAGGSINAGTIFGCSFNNFNSSSTGIDLSNPTNPTSSWTITSNTFNPSSPTTSSMNISLASQVMCLELIGNTAPGSVAYNLSAILPGELNRTIGSDSSTNTGGFMISGAVNAPGSCSLP